ncbi:single-stranded DNA-binding protein [filamentous cyanobacterium CCP2]|nr:single-stranded DNA-binding protein [filamentous cyanobacterium CCP2]
MSSIGLNKWIVSGHLAADVEMKTVELRSGEPAKVASGTLYVRKTRNRDESFTIALTIWEKTSAWRRLPYLKKGSVVICTGSVDVNPFISKNGNVPKAGIEMTVLDIDLDFVRNGDAEPAEPAAQMQENEQVSVAV